MNVPDVSELALPDLIHLRETVNRRINEMRAAGIDQLRATIAEQAELLGIDLKQLVPKKTRRKRAKDDESV